MGLPVEMTVKNAPFFTGFEVRQTLWACRWASRADSINVSSQRGLDRAENWRSDGGRELTLFFKRHQTIQQIKCLQGVRCNDSHVWLENTIYKGSIPQPPVALRHGQRDALRCHLAISQVLLSVLSHRFSSNCSTLLLRTSQRWKESISTVNSVACLLAKQKQLNRHILHWSE